MLASFIIPNHERINETLRLTNLIRPTDQADYEVIVVEYNTPEIVDYGSNIRVISVTDAPYGPDRGINMAHARNVGAAHAEGDWLVFLDCDIIPQNIAMGKLFGHLPALDKNTIYGGLRMKMSPQGSVIAYDPQNFNTADPVIFGFCLIIHKHPFKRLNGWNEGLAGWSAEDVDLVNRGKKMGMKTRILQDVQWKHPWHDEASWKGDPKAHPTHPGGYRVMQKTEFEYNYDKFMEYKRATDEKVKRVDECDALIKQAQDDALVKIEEARKLIENAKHREEDLVGQIAALKGELDRREVEWQTEREATREFVDSIEANNKTIEDRLAELEGDAIGYKDEAEHLRAELLALQTETPKKRRWWLLWLA